MKKTIFFILILSSLIAKAQLNGSFSIEWLNQSVTKTDSLHLDIPQFQPQNFYFDQNKKAIFLYLKFPISSSVDEKNFKISNLIYENISKSELGELSIESIPSNISASVATIKARNDLFCSIKLSPIINDGSGFKKLKSFSYELTNSSTANRVLGKPVKGVVNSVLATGDWFRFYIQKSGVYKISKNFLEQLGMNLDNVDIKNLKIYGNGGRMLPLSNAIDYPYDLAENAIYFQGDTDGVFNDQDFILFYAEGVDNWSAENETHINLYDTKSYYYVTIQGNAGKRITQAPIVTGTSTTISSFDDYQYYESDITNITKMGRKWFGEQFNIENDQKFSFNLPNLDTTTPIKLTVAVAGIARNSTSFDITANGTSLGSLGIPVIGVGDTSLGKENRGNYTLPASENININLKFNNNGVPISTAYLDYLVLNFKTKLQGYGKQFRFQYNDAAKTTGIGDFQITNTASIPQIWDITDIYNVTSYTNNGQPSFSFKANLGQVKKYIALDNQDFYIPSKEAQSRVFNQNLKGTVFKNNQGLFQDIDYLIITPSFLASSAEKLANFHRNSSGLNVKVVTLENIYQEFSSGKQDIGAIRNFVKYVYFNASSDDKKVKYLNLFGDASFDFKNLLKNKNETNVVPSYESLKNPFSLADSFVSDDFYVMMDDTEGNLDNTNDTGLDISVGRMPVSSSNQADEMINKVIQYHDVKAMGKWRNNFVLIADDIDTESDATLEKDINQVGDTISLKKPAVNVKKIISDSYIQEVSSGGERYPKVREDFNNELEQGALVFNYFGHGGEDGLAAERIFDKVDAQNLSNTYKYPLFVTMTCEFTRFDNPFRPTAGEYLYWNPKGGAISLVTTTRQIYINIGQSLNKEFSSVLYGLDSNVPMTIADALRLSKNKFNSNSIYTVFYIGDPAIKLAIPQPKVVLTKVNDIPITGVIDDFKALAVMKLTGEVRDETGNTLLSNYNGDLSVNIFDKTIDKKTLGNNGIKDASNNLITIDFKILGETIFRGNASVKNGVFEFTFVVPKDIRIPLGNGKISFYAKKTGQLLDQTGYDTTIKVGGINTNAVADNLPPRVKLFMNDESFISGGITNKSPILLAFLEDENGINTASGIGHDIVAILDGDATKPYVLNDYYETDPDNYKKGKIKFTLRNIAPGLHTISLKAWDVYNNPVSTEIQFLVVGDENITLTNVLNYPNPFVNYTQFWFTHNTPFEPLDVQVQVMTITGKVIKTINQLVTTEGFLSRDIVWDGRDDYGDRIGKGVYVYKLTVKSTITNKKSEKIEKLVIL